MKAPSAVVQGIHEDALLVVKKYKTCEVELIEILEKSDQFRVHYALGFSSLFKYATDGLGLSPEVAYTFINVARKTKEVPALKEEIKRGAITVSKAKRILSVLNHHNQLQWLDLARTSSKRELEKHVAAVAPEKAIMERTTYVNQRLERTETVKLMSLTQPNSAVLITRVQLQVGVSEKLMLKLRRVQDLVAAKINCASSLEAALDAMTNLYLEKHDPVKKAEQQNMRGKLQTAPQLGPGTIPAKSVSNHRRPLPASLKHQLMLKHKGQCAHLDQNGRRCQNRRHLDVHHKVEVAKGGLDELTNLTLLCTGHHRAHHHGQDFQSESLWQSLY